MTTQGTSVHHRKLACDNCRKSKVRCDGMENEKNCSRCLRKETKCTWDTPRFKRGRKTINQKISGDYDHKAAVRSLNGHSSNEEEVGVYCQQRLTSSSSPANLINPTVRELDGDSMEHDFKISNPNTTLNTGSHPKQYSSHNSYGPEFPSPTYKNYISRRNFPDHQNGLKSNYLISTFPPAYPTPGFQSHSLPHSPVFSSHLSSFPGGSVTPTLTAATNYPNPSTSSYTKSDETTMDYERTFLKSEFFPVPNERSEPDSGSSLAIAGSLPVSVPFVGHGHGVGFGYPVRDGMMEDSVAGRRNAFIDEESMAVRRKCSIDALVNEEDQPVGRQTPWAQNS